jgi:EAL domain-containing protein (putative c-di-GMP-specific phosphodiesterase class I)
MHVMRTALETLSAWRDAGLVGIDVCMSVNVSGRQFEDPGFAAQVPAAVAAAGLPADSLRLEITESTLMKEPELMREMIAAMCDTGVGLHLDDFGTGYSSLSVLHRFPVEALKIDRSFVASINDDDDDSDVIVRSTIALAHSLGLDVIAEGIEDHRQLQRLRSLGCEYGQGFLFSRPVSEPQMRQLLAEWTPAGPALLGEPVGPA